MKMILWYFRELLVYRFGVFHKEPKADIGVKDASNWHVTPQTNGLYATRQGLDTPAHAEYVSCCWPPCDEFRMLALSSTIIVYNSTVVEIVQFLIFS